MNIQEHVVLHWDALPKSTFDSETCVIIKQITNEDYGYGHHFYEGYGVTQDGALVWCYSSGCSCNGTCGQNHVKDAKVFETEWSEDFTRIDPAQVDFSALQVNFSSY